MKDERITIKTAKLLKEKRFDVIVRGSYIEYLNTKIDSNGGSYGWTEGEIQVDGGYFRNNDSGSDYSNKNYTMYAAPTQSLVARWLREDYEIYVFVNYRSFGVEDCNGWYYHIGKSPDHYSPDQFKTYEEAMEAGLRHALTQIP